MNAMSDEGMEEFDQKLVDLEEELRDLNAK